MLAFAAIAHALAALVAVHSVSWSLRDEPVSAVAFLPVSLTPLAAAPIWAPVESWAMLTAAGILLGVALAPVARWKLGRGSGAGDANAIRDSLAPVAIGEVLIVFVYFVALFAGRHAGGFITHAVSALAAATLLATGSAFIVLK